MKNDDSPYFDRYLLYSVIHALVQVNHPGAIEPLHSDNTVEIESVVSALTENLLEGELKSFAFTIALYTDIGSKSISESELKDHSSIHSLKKHLLEKYNFKFSKNSLTVEIYFSNVQEFIDKELKPYLFQFVDNKLIGENRAEFSTSLKVFTEVLNEITAVQGRQDITLKSSQFGQILNQNQKIDFKTVFPELEIVISLYLSGAIDLNWIGNFEANNYEYGISILNPSIIDANRLRTFFGLKPVMMANAQFTGQPYIYDRATQTFEYQTNSGKVIPLKISTKKELTHQGKVFLAFLNLWERDREMRGHYSNEEVEESMTRMFGTPQDSSFLKDPIKKIRQKISQDPILGQAISWHKEREADKKGWVFRINPVN